MVRTWVDWLLDLPWVDPPAETLDIERAAAILDEDHYGLTKVKDRILEWLAVRERIRAKDGADLAAAEAAAEASAETAKGAVADRPGGGWRRGGQRRSAGRAAHRRSQNADNDGSDPAGERRGVPAPTGPAAHATAS